MSIIPNAPELLSEAQREELARQKKNDQRIARERSIVRGLIRALKAQGWNVTHVNDGEMVKVANETEALEAVFSVDHSRIWFTNAAKVERQVFITAGEGDDIICDHSDAEDFTPHIDAFMRAKGLI